jgi:hypothetical protein
MGNVDRTSKLGFAFIFVFATPFALFGLFAISKAIEQLSTGEGNQPVWLPLLFGVIFCGVGFGLMAAALFGGRIYQRTLRLQAEHPSEPWLWRADWAQGRVQSKTRGNMIARWVFAIFWNAVSMPVAYLVTTQGVTNPAAYLALIFPVIGVFLLFYAIRQSLAYFEFGKTYFEMASVPGVIGRELRGVVQARFPHSPDHGIHLRLSCVHRVTSGSGNSQSTMESIVWRDEADLSSAQLCPGPTGTSFPVSFHIPAEAQATQKLSPRDEYAWLLEALADVPGVDYHDIFEVPVFRTQQSPTPSDPEPEVFAARPVSRPEVMTVEVRENAAGTEFFFPAARNKGFAAVTNIFLFAFATGTFFLFRGRIPIIFGVGCGLFSVVLLFITIQMWFGTTRVVIGNGTLSLQKGLLGGGKTQMFQLSDIASIRSKIGAQQGGATGTPYYDIELGLRNGSSLTLGRTIRDRHETDWLVEKMQQLAGLKGNALSAGSAG